MKIGIDSYCFHRYFGEVYPNQQDPGRRISYEDFLRRAIQWGVDGVCLETCFFESGEEGYFQRLKEIIDEGQLECVVAWGHPDGLEGGKNEAAVAEMESHFRTCEILQAKVMRMVGSSLTFRHEPHQPQIDRLVQLLRDPVKRAEDRGVKLAMENHLDFTADEMLEILQQIGSDFFGVTLDTGNALRIGDEVVAATEKLASYVLATHTKDVAPQYGGNPQDWHFFASVPVGKGVVNIPGVAKTLLAAGYEGLFAIEFDYLDPKYGDEDTALVESVEYLKSVRQSLS